MVRKLLILAGDTDNNLGDLAIVTATCDAIRRVDKNVEISIVSGCPARDRACLGVMTIPRGWRGLGTLLRAARHSDLTICGGGGLFQDDDSLIKMPYWACRLVVLRLFAKRLVGLSIGAGPLRHPSSRVFARVALATMNSISVRDHLASSTVAPLTPKPVKVVPDPAFMLHPADDTCARTALLNAGIPDDGSPLIGVALRRWFHTGSNVIPHKYAFKYGLRRISGDNEMSVYVRNIASLLDRVVRTHDARIVFMPSYNVPHENDAEICRNVGEQMQSNGHAILELDDPRIYKAVTARFSAMLCGRMHPAILAAGQGIPTIGIAYNPKFHGMFELIGQAERCVPIESLLRPETIDIVANMLSDAMNSPTRDRDRVSDLATQSQTYIRDLIDDASRGAGRPAPQDMAA